MYGFRRGRREQGAKLPVPVPRRIRLELRAGAVAIALAVLVIAYLVQQLYAARATRQKYVNTQIQNLACSIVEFTPPGESLTVDKLRHDFPKCPPYRKPAPTIPPAPGKPSSTRTAPSRAVVTPTVTVGVEIPVPGGRITDTRTRTVHVPGRTVTRTKTKPGLPIPSLTLPCSPLHLPFC